MIFTHVCISQYISRILRLFLLTCLRRKMTILECVHCWRRLLSLECPLDSKEIKSVNLEGNQPWILIGRVGRNWCWSSSILVIWCEDPTHWKSPWCWGKLRAEREEGVRGWNGWVASPMQWTWIWTNFRRWWGTGSLACYCLWGRKESDMTGWLNNNKKGWGKWGDVCQRVQTFNYKMKKLWVSNVQHGHYS